MSAPNSKPQSLIEMDLESREGSPAPEHDRQHEQGEYTPVTLRDRVRADTLPITMQRIKPGQGAVITRIKRKQVPASGESFSHTTSALISEDERSATPETYDRSDRDVERERDEKAKAAATAFLQENCARKGEGEDGEEEETKAARRLTRQNSKGMSWLSL